MFNSLLTNGPAKHKYNLEDYDFVGHARKVFSCDDLSLVHEKHGVNFGVLTFDTDQSTLFHRMWYSQGKKSNFYSIYRRFIENEIRPLFDESIIYQKIPTFRTQVPNNLGVAEWHRDSDYSHFRGEMNIFLPLTRAHDTATVWTESAEGREDYAPLNADPGEFYVWLGSVWNHGNKMNDTGVSRVSIDFRVMPLAQYKETDNVSTTYKMKMTIGEYFEICE
mgnify:CR=1 FL=1